MLHVRPRMTHILTRRGMTKSEARSTLESLCYLRVVVMMRNQRSQMGKGKSDEHPPYEELIV
ncbi:hypothetical protein Taro_000957 [Colocasia esculenta]|uniref:Uncharacterized protein n=1 Tax=Colocasia esculenta TaxID=4460 RepID=A0A843THV1_COLES|nr:hypothetical protein [Colocasia esculenta]